MRFRTLLLILFAVLMTWGVLFAQKPFKRYSGGEDGDVPLPAVDDEKAPSFSPSRVAAK